MRPELGPLADPLLAALVDLLLPERHADLERVDRLLTGGERVLPVRRRHGDHDARVADADAAHAVVDRDLGQLVLGLERRGQLGHDLLGHALVSLVVEVDDVAAAGVDARGPDEGRDRSGLGTLDLRDHGVHVERLLAEPDRAARDRRDQRHLVAVAERPVAVGVLLVDGVEEAGRLVAEAEGGPDLGDRRRLDLARRPAGALAQAGEETDTHPARHRSPDYAAASSSSRFSNSRTSERYWLSKSSSLVSGPWNIVNVNALAAGPSGTTRVGKRASSSSAGPANMSITPVSGSDSIRNQNSPRPLTTLCRPSTTFSSRANSV